jgi:hypothetical protein
MLTTDKQEQAISRRKYSRILYENITFRNKCSRNAYTLFMAEPSFPRLAVSRECQIHETRKTASSLSLALKYRGIEFLAEIQPRSEIGVYLKELTPSKHHSTSISPSEKLKI